MARRNYSNTAAQTYITSGITAGSTSLVVYNASGYPTVPFTVRCDAEIILVGAKSGTTFSTLTRGFDGTTAASHSLGAVVEHRAVRDDFSYRWINPVTDKTSTNTFTDHFDNESLDAAWTEVTPTGTVTWTEGKDALSAKFKNQSGNDCAALLKTMGALSYPVVVTTAVRVLNVGNYCMAGPVFTNGTTAASNAIWAMPFVNTLSLRTGTLTNISATLGTERLVSTQWIGWLYIRMIWRATNTWNIEWSPDGISYTDYAGGNLTYSMTPTHFGLGVSAWGNTLDQIASFEYFDVSTDLP